MAVRIESNFPAKYFEKNKSKNKSTTFSLSLYKLLTRSCRVQILHIYGKSGKITPQRLKAFRSFVTQGSNIKEVLGWHLINPMKWVIALFTLLWSIAYVLVEGLCLVFAKIGEHSIEIVNLGCIYIPQLLLVTLLTVINTLVRAITEPFNTLQAAYTYVLGRKDEPLPKKIKINTDAKQEIERKEPPLSLEKTRQSIEMPSNSDTEKKGGDEESILNGTEVSQSKNSRSNLNYKLSARSTTPTFIDESKSQLTTSSDDDTWMEPEDQPPSHSPHLDSDPSNYSMGTNITEQETTYRAAIANLQIANLRRKTATPAINHNVNPNERNNYGHIHEPQMYSQNYIKYNEPKNKFNNFASNCIKHIQTIFNSPWFRLLLLLTLTVLIAFIPLLIVSAAGGGSLLAGFAFVQPALHFVNLLFSPLHTAFLLSAIKVLLGTAVTLISLSLAKNVLSGEAYRYFAGKHFLLGYSGKHPNTNLRGEEYLMGSVNPVKSSTITDNTVSFDPENEKLLKKEVANFLGRNGFEA